MKEKRERIMSLPEIKEMVQTAKRYIEDDATVIELHGVSAVCADWATRFELHPEIIALAKRWRNLADESWNEWGMKKKPLSPEELKKELRKDLDEIDKIP